MVKVIAAMRRTYSASFFASFYYGILVILAATWLKLREQSSDFVQVSGWVFLASFAILGIPLLYARVIVDEKGIRQSFYRNQFIPWHEVVSWKRNYDIDGDGQDTLTIRTRRDSVTLNHNCIFGKRLAEVEAELKSRVEVSVPNAGSRRVQ